MSETLGDRVMLLDDGVDGLMGFGDLGDTVEGLMFGGDLAEEQGLGTEEQGLGTLEFHRFGRPRAEAVRARRTVVAVERKRQARRAVACVARSRAREDLERVEDLDGRAEVVRRKMEATEPGLERKRLAGKLAVLDAVRVQVGNRALSAMKLATLGAVMAKANRLQKVLGNAFIKAQQSNQPESAKVISVAFGQIGKELAQWKRTRARQKTIWTAGTAESRANVATAVLKAREFDIQSATARGDPRAVAVARLRVMRVRAAHARMVRVQQATACAAARLVRPLGDVNALEFGWGDLNPIKAVTKVAGAVKDAAVGVAKAGAKLVKGAICAVASNPLVDKAVGVAVTAGIAATASPAAAAAAQASGASGKVGGAVTGVLKKAGCSGGKAPPAKPKAAKPEPRKPKPKKLSAIAKALKKQLKSRQRAEPKPKKLSAIAKALKKLKSRQRGGAAKTVTVPVLATIAAALLLL